jgi:hypothetical protein
MQSNSTMSDSLDIKKPYNEVNKLFSIRASMQKVSKF